MASAARLSARPVTRAEIIVDFELASVLASTRWNHAAPAPAPDSLSRDTGLAGTTPDLAAPSRNAAASSTVAACGCPCCGWTGSDGVAAMGGVSTPYDPLYNGTGDAVTSVARTGDQRIDALLIGTRWSDGFITYSNPDSAADYQAGYSSDQDGDGISAQNEGFSAFSAQQMVSMHAALNSAVYTQLAGSVGFSVEGFTNLGIDFGTSGSGNGTIRAANSSDPGTSYAFYPNSGFTGGDTFIGPSARTPTAGNYSWHTMWHELGHSLGLKHGHETSVYGALPAAYNSNEYSIMTYATFIGDTQGGVDYETWGAPQTFMMLDIAALQAMYGADYSVNSGNTTYSWSQTGGETYVNGSLAIDPGGNRIFMTVWDGGGIDTYDLSNYTSSCEIDLTAGGYCDFNSGQSAYLGGGPNSGYARGNVFNALLYGGNTASLIENANGGSGNDTITGNQADNTLRGNGGSDVMNGGAGTDTLYGGEGNDSLNGGGGNGDVAYGENGNDTIYWGPPSPSSARYMSGGTGIDTIHGGGTSFGTVTFNLGAGTYDTGGGFAETWVGFENYYNYGVGNEIVIGSSGNNRLQTGSGSNVLDGGDGEDVLLGGAGNDTIYGGFFTDTVYGEAGNDLFVIRGTASSTEFGDNTDGGADVDTLDLAQVLQYGVILNLTAGTWQYNPAYGPVWTVANVENVNGTQLADVITGSSATNILRGNGGNDTINGGGGAADQMYGDGGNDRIYWAPSPGSARTVDGGADNDTIDGGGASFVNSVTFNLGAGTYTYANGGFTESWTNFENYFNNGTGVEAVIGTTGANLITTGSGNNALSGGDGNDTLDGGAGDDTMDGGTGIDAADYRTATAGVTVNAQIAAAQVTGGSGTDTLIGIEALWGSAFADVLTGTGTSGGFVRGGDGNDTIFAALGSDDLDGGAGTDTLDTTLWDGDYVVDLTTGLTNFGGELMINFENIISGDGNDVLTGTNGANRIRGGIGNDSLIGGLGNDLLDGGAGRDTADYSAATGAVTVNLFRDVEQNTGSAGRDTLIRIENVIGSAFDDTLTGSKIANTLNGGGGDDALVGGDGKDRLIGGGGVDTLTGGKDADMLNGGGGKDRFVFAAGDSNGSKIDTIADFDTASDRIDLSALAEDLGARLDFIGTSAFSNTAGEVRYRAVGTDTRVQVDTDGDGSADLTILCTGAITFEQNDFVLAAPSALPLFG
jgi:serralysin